MMSREEDESIKETLMLLSEPGFKDAFEESVKQADNGETVSCEEVFGEAL